MARGPQTRAPQASAEEDFYGEDEADLGGDDGQDTEWEERDDNQSEARRSAEHSGETDDELDQVDEDQPAPRRGEGRIQRLANQNRELQRRLEELERRPAGQPAPQTGPRPETEQELETRIALMDESQKGYERWRWSNSQNQAQLNQTRADTLIRQDKADFRDMCRDDKLAARLASKVEEEFQNRLRNNIFVPRQDIYWWLAGKERASGGKEQVRAREAAARRVDRQTVRPQSSGSDVARPSRRDRVDERTARARRLQDVQI